MASLTRLHMSGLEFFGIPILANQSVAMSFTARYNIYKRVCFEPFHAIEEAIAREKQVKLQAREEGDDPYSRHFEGGTTEKSRNS